MSYKIEGIIKHHPLDTYTYTIHTHIHIQLIQIDYYNTEIIDVIY